MSSSRYSSTLRPDPWLRIVVLTSGRLLIAAGLVLILVLDMLATLRGLAGLVWSAAGYYELSCLAKAFRHLHAIRLSSDGSVQVLDSDQEWVAGELDSGCIVLQKLAWLRVRAANGVRYIELLRGDTRGSQNWRRLQVIWRHVGAGR